MVEVPTAKRSFLTAMAGVGGIWAAFLIPPILWSWDGFAAPGWARALEGTPPYDAIRAVASGVGVQDDYVVFGVLVAPAFLLIGAPLVVVGRGVGRWVSCVGWLLVAGAPLSALSYIASSDARWDAFSGTELVLLVLVAVVALVAGISSGVRRRAPVPWCALLAATPVVLAASALVLVYVPHGALAGLGAAVAVLAATAPVPARSDVVDHPSSS